MSIVNKKTVVAFVMGLVVMGLVWKISTSMFTKLLPGGAPTESAEMQEKMTAGRQVALNSSITTIQRAIPWTVAVKLIETASVEKIELSSGLEIKLIIKDGPIFTTMQPTKDAYLVTLKNTESKIKVIK